MGSLSSHRRRRTPSRGRRELMPRIAVMHVVDALRIGGAERVAINLANLLPQDDYDAYLCTTRDEGPLANLVAPHVKSLSLRRRSTLDLSAVLALVKFV